MAVTTKDKTTEIGKDRSGFMAARHLAAILFAKRFGGLWVLVAIIILFSILIPQTFLTVLTLQTTLSDGAVTAIMALGVMFPLLTGIFDISIAWVAGFAMVFSSYLNVRFGMGTLPVCVITLCASSLFGALSALFVTKLKVNSIVTTLGVGTIALGLTEMITQGNSITPAFSSAFFYFGQGVFYHIPLPFIYAVVIAVAMYYVLEHTALGRRLRAVGGNPGAARLAGVRVLRLQAGVLVCSALMSGFAGLVLATEIGTATESTAPAFLLPAAAAVFLGATQIKVGPNPSGTLLAILLLGTGIKGLQLMGANTWVGDFFNGVVLLIAVAVSGEGIERLV
jgi:ribose transport system permease protein